MDISHIEHVGIAVPSLDERIPFYENDIPASSASLSRGWPIRKCAQPSSASDRPRSSFSNPAEDSAIAKFIASNGGRGGIQHITFAVADGWPTPWLKSRGEKAAA